MRPLLLKVGVALSLSVAGYLYSRFSSRADRRRRLRRLHPHGAAPGVEGGREPCGGLKDEIFLQQREEARSDVTDGAAAGILVAGAAEADVCLSPQGKISREEEERLLSEFNALVALQEFESGGRDMAALESPPLKRSVSDYKKGAADDVVADLPEVLVLLKSLVRSLQEPEIPLLKYYYGLREPEYSAAVELESRLKVSAVEADFLNSVKIESLQAENRRLAAQAADHRETKAELESASAKVRRLRRKLRSESVRVKERVAVLQRRLAALQDMERRRGEAAAEEAERRMTRVKELEGEVAELRRANSNLAMENSDMAKKLETMQRMASSVLPSSEATKAAMEESNSLRQKSEELTKQLEQLQTDNCTNVEELVYLRWVNACLRYELRNYQPPPGKTAARDLSRTLSSRSEHKVKQLILEYANAGGVDEKSISMTDFDSETCSSSQASSGEGPEDVAVEVPNSASPVKSGGSSGKKKFFTKLKRLVLSKEKKLGQSKFDSPVGAGIPTVSGGSSSARRASASASASASSSDDMVTDGRTSCDSAASCATPDHYAKADHGKRDGGSPWTRDLSRVPANVRGKPKAHLRSASFSFS